MNNKLYDTVLLDVWFAIRESAWDTVRRSMKDSVTDAATDSTWNFIWSTPENSIIASVGQSVGDYFKQQ